MSGDMSFVDSLVSKGKVRVQGQCQGQGEEEDLEKILTGRDLNVFVERIQQFLVPHLPKGEKSAAVYLRKKREEFQQVSEDFEKSKKVVEGAMKDRVEKNAPLAELLNNYKEEKVKVEELRQRYGVVLRMELEEMEMRQEIAKLEDEIKSQPEELQGKLADAYVKLEKAIEELGQKCEEKADKLRKYEDLGGLFAEIRDEFQTVEEGIKTKLWVKEELEKEVIQGSQSESSFYDRSVCQNDSVFSYK